MAVRVDAWLWAVRMTKTRTAATDACKAGHVRVNGERAKPATPLHPGDEVRLRTTTAERTVRVLELLAKRVGAPRAQAAYLDLTPPAPPRVERPAGILRERGAGRPTKRERRELERLRGRA
ncbi:MAG: RNA-binding S4 domain-containing protein [Microbacteriaceae bacterium]